MNGMRDQIATLSNKSLRHGHTSVRGHYTTIYRAWINMKTRCFNIKSSHYLDYGGRGITVCSDWLIFENFFRDMGEPQKGYSLDRIDNNGGYNKENCRWSTISEQSRNKRSNVLYTLNGETLCLAEWASRIGVNGTTITYRLRRGWPLALALTSKKAPPQRVKGSFVRTWQSELRK